MRKRITRALMVGALVANMGVGLVVMANGARASAPTGPTGPAIDNVLPTPPGNSGDNAGSPGDDCSQGASDATCVPDPSVNGQDCLDHGNAAGNENHCEEVQPSPSPSPSVSPSPEPSPSPSTTPEPSPSITTEPTVSSIPPVVVTTEAPAPQKTSSRSDSKPPKAGGNETKTRDLAFTGLSDTQQKGGLMVLFSLLGLFMMGMGRALERSLNEGMDLRDTTKLRRTKHLNSIG